LGNVIRKTVAPQPAAMISAPAAIPLSWNVRIWPLADMPLALFDV